MQQVGTDYADVAAVEEYDERMASFRDVDAENRSALEALALRPGSAVLEIISAEQVRPCLMAYHCRKAT